MRSCARLDRNTARRLKDASMGRYDAPGGGRPSAPSKVLGLRNQNGPEQSECSDSKGQAGWREHRTRASRGGGREGGQGPPARAARNATRFSTPGSKNRTSGASERPPSN